MWDPVTNAVGYNVFLTTNKVLDVNNAGSGYRKVFLKTNSISFTNLAKGHYKAGVAAKYIDGDSAPNIIDVDVK